jgi:PKD repeat protein
MLRRAYWLLILAALAGAVRPAVAMPSAPGDTSSVVLLDANFDTDTAGLPPDVTLPAPPPGDYLTLEQSGGSTLVQSSLDGFSYPVVLRQENTPSPVAVQAWLAPRDPGLERMTVRWRSLARDDNPIFLMSCVLRSPGGSVIASVDYNPHNELSYNGASGVGPTLPIAYDQNRNQQFTVEVDFLAQTTSLAIDGAAVPGFQGVPFVAPATDLARVGFEVGPSHPQTFAADEISAVAFIRTPDDPPVVTAPASQNGAEGSPLHFLVSASDPDGQAIESLTAAPLPDGAMFNADAGNATGAFDWTPGYSQAGPYTVTFTATNTLSGSAVTAIDIGNVDRPPTVEAPANQSGAEGNLLSFTVGASDPDGDAITALSAAPLPAGALFTPGAGNAIGAFSWTPGFTQAGSYSVAFTASNALTGTGTTAILIANTDRPPVVAAPAAQSGAEGSQLTFTVTAADPDDDAIVSLMAATLPGGAMFTPNAAKTSGTFTWTPAFSQAGTYNVTFTASNALTGTATTEITIVHTDRAPVVAAPAAIDAEEGGTLIFTVAASDPDGDPISSLTADRSLLPAGNDATFTPGPGNLSGTFVWHIGAGQGGSYPVTFAAANALTGVAYTRINVAASGTNVAGELIWTPEPGMEGLYQVTFTATNQYGESSTAVTQLEIFPESPAAAPAPSRDEPGVAPKSPESPQKGPIISAPGYLSGSVRETLTAEVTATESGTGSLVRALSLRVPSLAMAGLTLTADVTQLPEGNNAVFIVDRDPEVGAPIQTFAEVQTQVSINVTAADPDADPIYALTADFSGLPSVNDAAFTANGTHTAGVFTWTPSLADSGDFVVTFMAANALVGHASTTIHVQGVAAATAYSLDKKIRLQANKPHVCMVVQPAGGSFMAESILLSTVRLVSPGTGVVSEIPAGGKSAIVDDRNKDQIQDITICFAKGDVRDLFSLLRGNQDVPVTVEGRLIGGRRFVAPLTLTVLAGGGPLQASVSPNPLNPTAQLSFYTTKPGPLRVRVYDLGGRLVRELMNVSFAAAGEHQLTVEGRDGRGRPLASGVYYFRIEAANGESAGRFTILK